MENIINYIVNHFAIFLTITIMLLFALIGYIYDSKKNKSDLLRKNEEEFDEELLENIIVPEGKGLAETVNVSKNINPETGGVQLTDESILNENSNSTES